MASAVGSQSRFAQLDGLRWLAALSVVVAHFNPVPLAPSPNFSHGLFTAVSQLSLANLGVVFFYVLSAFLLTFLAVREHDRTRRLDTRKFYARRAFRIWPLYFVILGLDVWLSRPGSLFAVAYSLDPTQWAWVKTHLPYFVGFVSNWSLALNHVSGYVDHSSPPFAILWSIAVEEQFYVLFPLCIYLSLRSHVGLRRLIIGVSVVGLLFRLAFRYVPVNPGDLGPAGGMYYATLSYCDVFLVGGIAGWIAARGSPEEAGWVRALRWPGAGPVIILVAAVVSTLWRGQLWYPYAIYSVLIYPFTGAVFAAIILWTIANSGSAPSRLLQCAPMAALGVISYGIYLWHPIAAAIVRFNLGVLVPDRQASVDFLATMSFWEYLAATICGATLTYITVERPFLNLKERLWSTEQHATAKAGAPLSATWALGAGIVSVLLIVACEVAIRAHLGVFAQTRLASLAPVTLKSIRPKDTATMRALFFPTTQQAAFAYGTPFGGAGAAHSAMAILIGDPGIMFLVQSTGRVAKVMVPDGQKILIQNVGEWNSLTSSLSGLYATSRHARWVIDEGVMHPVVQNDLGPGRGDGIPGLWVSPGNATYTIKRMHDRGESFVRVTALKSSSYLSISGTAPLSRLDHMPVSIRGRIRAHSRLGHMSLSLYDVVAKDGRAMDHRTETTPRDPWTTLTVGTDHFVANTGSNYSIGLVGVQAGDWFDVRELDVFVGLLPLDPEVGTP